MTNNTYGVLKLTASSPAQSFTEVLSLAEVKGFLRIPAAVDDAQQDSLLGIYIIAARETAEILQNRDLVQKQWDYYLEDFLSFQALNNVGNAGTEIPLRKPLATVDLVQYTDSDGTITALVENTDYRVDTARSIITPIYGGSWPAFTPNVSSSVLIRYTSGYGATDIFWSNDGNRIKIGMLILISLWFNERLPFVPATRREISELPFTITDLLNFGADVRVI